MELKLKEYIKELNISTYQLEKQTQISHKALYDLVNNKTKGITFETLDKICKVLNCTPNDIIKW